MEDIKLIHCLTCGNVGRVFTFAGIRDWTYVKCQRCGLVFLYPMPTEAQLADFYAGTYSYDVEQSRKKVEETGDRFLERVEKYLPSKGKFLEVGCSYGHFLHLARNKGWQVAGVELSPETSSYAREKLGLEVYTGMLNEAICSQVCPVDAVALFHVLEHMPFPGEVLKLLHANLNPGGILTVKVPNAASLIGRLTGSNWQWFSPPEHIYMFDPKTIGTLLEKSGFKILEMYSCQGDAHNNLFEFTRATLRKLIPQQHESVGGYYRPKVYEDKPWYKLIEFFCSGVCIFFRPLDWLLAKRLLQPELVVVARKR